MVPASLPGMALQAPQDVAPRSLRRVSQPVTESSPRSFQLSSTSRFATVAASPSGLAGTAIGVARAIAEGSPKLSPASEEGPG